MLAGARGGDRESIGELLAHYRTYLTLLATAQIQRRIRPRVSPSDIVQETMLKAHRSFAQFRGLTERELLAWLREILVNSLARLVEQHVLAAKRDVRREVSIEGFAAEAGEPPVRAVANLKAAWSGGCQGEQSAFLAGLLARLPGHYREVLVLRNIEGLSFEEVATRLNRSPGATRMLWLRAIEKLRALYRKAEQYDP
ncbi:MAG: sigma-70 family RNA polymerase sigma factor [Planctomycetaceae bacterium]|nr:sigma-70 family RNA polymerase sigma factor [Planctomycetaceae bacterium]